MLIKQGTFLFVGRNEKEEVCHESRCGLPRYKQYGKSLVPTKVLRFSPIIPRLQRLFRSTKISSHLL